MFDTLKQGAHVLAACARAPVLHDISEPLTFPDACAILLVLPILPHLRQWSAEHRGLADAYAREFGSRAFRQRCPATGPIVRVLRGQDGQGHLGWCLVQSVWGAPATEAKCTPVFAPLRTSAFEADLNAVWYAVLCACARGLASGLLSINDQGGIAATALLIGRLRGRR